MSATSSVTPDPVAAPPQPARLRGMLASSRSRGLLLVGMLVLAVVFFIGGDAWLSVLDFTMIAAIATLGLNVLSGYAGQISLGLAFFMAIGAYTAAVLGGDPPASPHDPAGMGLSFLIWLPAAGVAAGLVGALVGPTALRLKGFYLGIVTLALIFIGEYLFRNLRGITGGAQGRAFPSPGWGDFSFASPTVVFGIELTTNQWYFLLVLLVLVLAAVFVANIARSRAGRALQAVRDNETGAMIMGINLFQAKMGAFVLSSVLAGIAGALWASFTGFAEPGTWSLVFSIQFVAAMLVGGVASVWGSIVGAAFVFALPLALEALSLLPESASASGISSGDLSAIIYGLLIIVFLLFEPTGIIGLIRRLQMLFQRFDARNKGGDPAGARVATASTSSIQSASRPGDEQPHLAPRSDAHASTGES